LSKLIGSRLDWGAVFALYAAGTLIVVLATSPSSFILRFTPAVWTGLLAGLLGGLGFFFFYQALAQGPASTVIPLSSLYFLVAAVLAVVFLHEPVTVKKVLGILFAVASIVLLTR